MSSDSKPISPVQGLLDGIIELQRRLEELEPNIHNNRAKSQYENIKMDAKSAIWALGTVWEKV